MKNESLMTCNFTTSQGPRVPRWLLDINLSSRFKLEQSDPKDLQLSECRGGPGETLDLFLLLARGIAMCHVVMKATREGDRKKMQIREFCLEDYSLTCHKPTRTVKQL